MSRYPRNVEMPRYAEFRGGLERNNEGKWMEYQIARDLVDRLEAENAALTRRISFFEARIEDKNNNISQIERSNHMELERLKKEATQLRLENSEAWARIESAREALNGGGTSS
jgi:hypothetical protein